MALAAWKRRPERLSAVDMIDRTNFDSSSLVGYVVVVRSAVSINVRLNTNPLKRRLPNEARVLPK
jgi:hypothetical protein